MEESRKKSRASQDQDELAITLLSRENDCEQNEACLMSGRYIQHNNLSSKLCLKCSHTNHVIWNKMTYCVVTAH